MSRTAAKAVGIWLLLVIAAILNGLLRESLFTPLLGAAIALPASGITLSLLVLLVSWLLIPAMGSHPARVFILTGLAWVAMTVAFEYLFGHFVQGLPWHEIHAVFRVDSGNLFSVVLLTSALAPWLAAKLRGRLLQR